MITKKHSVRSVMVAMLVSALSVAGCGYGQVSPTAYEFAKALYAISNRQAGDRLDPISEQVTVARDDGQLTDREAKWLHDIIAQARDGYWKSAEQASRRMLEDQITD